ncbi:hypothetical protein C8R45DRAFT_1218423 [Mycena sanguinolenta]|nr:hypothetical protein C8R45DRAFT_1218423 [Mycena sanguinolenta]
MPSLVSPSLTQAQAYILGGWDLAICFTLFLQGVLCSQFAHYMGSTKRDSWQIKALRGLALLTTLKSSECLAIMWVQNVTPFENVKGASTLWRTAWYSNRVAESSYSILRPDAFLLPALGGQYLEMYILSLYASWCSREPHMGFMVFGDLILTGSIIFWLLRHNKAVLSRGPTATILSSLVRLAVQAICRTTHPLLADQFRRCSPPSKRTRHPAFLMLNFITNNILPHLYAWSATWTLNSRNEIVAAGNIRYTLNLGIASYASDVKAGQIPHASNGVVSAGTHQEDQASS